MIRFFTGCRTAEDVKARFKDLAKKHHPDCGGDAEVFKAMMAEYKQVFERLKNTHETAAGETYTRETAETPEEFAEIIEALLHMDGVTVEIIGSWIWLTGNTMVHKDAIKALGFFWSRNKKAWYYNGDDHKTRRRGRYSMDGLRDRWGSQIVGTGRDDVRKLA